MLKLMEKEATLIFCLSGAMSYQEFELMMLVNDTVKLNVSNTGCLFTHR